MLVTVNEFDPAGQLSDITIQTDHISSIKQEVMDFSYVCQVCLVGGLAVARHNYDWCVETDRVSEFHERQVGNAEEPVTIISMVNGDTIIAKGSPQLVSLVGV